VNGRPFSEVIDIAGLTLTHGDYYLEIPSAQVIHSAVYTCIASNAAGELQKKFDLEVQGAFTFYPLIPPLTYFMVLCIDFPLSVIHFRIKLIFSLHMLPVPPVIDRTNLETRLTVIENRTRTIFCPVYATPPPSIIWFKDKVCQPSL